MTIKVIGMIEIIKDENINKTRRFRNEPLGNQTLLTRCKKINLQSCFYIHYSRNESSEGLSHLHS